VDPDKAVDLAAGGPAGPVLTVLDETGAPLGTVGTQSWAGLGSHVQTHLQVLDNSPLAVTIKGTIRFAAGPREDIDQPVAGASQPSTAPVRRPADQQAGPAADTQPAPASDHTYVYTIRQDGRVFVDINATVATETFRPAGIGLAVTTLNAPFQLRQVDPLDADLLMAMSDKADASQPATQEVLDDLAPRQPLPRALLLARVRPGGTNVLLAPGQVAAFRRVVSATRQTGDVTAHLYAMDPPPGGKIRLAAMLAIWPPDLRDLPTAAAIARDYQQPTPPHVEVGRLRTDAPGDLDGDGFAEATGQWVVEPDGQVLRLRWPAGQLRFWPMMHVANLAGKACWPYLDGRIIKPVERKTNGDAEFVVPGILSRTALLEVTVEK